ncbi:hypothetical protein RclHR1_00600017 [Rhizophagus clarus]|uniref:Jacalin-type lectin domain-containing protein n=1 Tax=Rhizophagus clarus TaxID=94130 RepID=A0A2Z6RQV7_9GLOM|nr:hypothetical protein RclHR1_00600017 [Rhizophagus clarus]
MDKTYSWDDRMEEFLSILCHTVKAEDSKIRPVQNIFLSLPLLSALTILFFLKHENNDDDDIFVQIKDRAKDIISKEIIEIEFNNWIRNFQPIKKLLLEYLVTRENDIRAIHIANLVEKCNSFFEEILKSEKIIHLIPFTITFAIIHFTVLRESLKLRTFQSDGEVGEVKDIIGSKTVNYFAKTSNYQIFVRVVFDLIKLRMFNEAVADFMKIFLYIFSLANFIHDHEPSYNISWPLSISSFWVGPYGIDTFPDGSHKFDDNSHLLYNMSDNESGVITKIKLRSGDIIDHIQVFYEDGRVGKKIGDGGGTEHIISDLDKSSKYIVAVNLKFGIGLLGKIEFIFNDGNTSGSFGRINKTTGSIQIGPFGKCNKFRLSGIIGGGAKRGSREYAAHIAFRFQHVDSL